MWRFFFSGSKLSIKPYLSFQPKNFCFFCVLCSSPVCETLVGWSLNLNDWNCMWHLLTQLPADATRNAFNLWAYRNFPYWNFSTWIGKKSIKKRCWIFGWKVFVPGKLSGKLYREIALQKVKSDKKGANLALLGFKKKKSKVFQIVLSKSWDLL